ncbi:type II toxin-antitoxin system Phd/YefM family antitoxin [Roseomonas aeriglobus]|nr:type II toxin-antitoxin system Phd/YefM family antitoxin [Roseomonas aeriglobus]
MSIVFSSRDFNRDPASIKRAAQAGPVFITDRNKPSLVVLAIKDYERLAGRGKSLFDVLATDGDHDFEFDPPKSQVTGRTVDLD